MGLRVRIGKKVSVLRISMVRMRSVMKSGLCVGNVLLVMGVCGFLIIDFVIVSIGIMIV